MENLLDKKQSIIESALELIHTYGFHGCPVSQVAKNAGVAAGTIYTYFENKDDLIVGIYDFVAKKITLYVSERDDASLDFETRFFNYWKNFTEFYGLHPAIHGFYDQFLNSPFNSEEVQNKPNMWHEWAYKFFQSGMDEGAIRVTNPVVLSILVNTNINSTVKIKKNFKNKLARTNVNLEEISHLIWAGIKTA